ncbi:MAG: thermonuclease family protein [Prevotella sp.]|jgi:endonuclease YncB( thermonuclease family)|nr:thermonuclease family protein [Prevotella sp.]
MHFISFLLTLFLSLNTTITGKVVKVSDGDTIIILDSTNTQHKIRLYGIDCPEKKQDYGVKATEFTGRLCAGKVVRVEVKGRDRYGRTLGIVYAGEININEALLRNGLAWHYKQFDKSKRYAALENETRIKRLNIWNLKNPVAPWDFRKRKH